MKKLFLSALAALTLSASGAIAEIIIKDGCEWKLAEGSNYYTRVDPGCDIGKNGGGAIRVKSDRDPAEPEDPIDPKDPADPIDPEDPKDPSDPKDPEDPADPKDPEDPADPGDGGDTGPTDPGPTDPGDGDEGDNPSEPTKPEKPCKGKGCGGGKPGNGWGDKNHEHNGPPGLNKKKK